MAYRNAAVVYLTGAMREKIISKDVAEERVRLVSDWSEPELFDLPLSGGGQHFRQQYEIGDRFIVSHSGNMGVKQGLEVVLGAAEIARDSHPELLFLLVGDGAVKSKLQETARLRRLGNVVFLPILPGATFHDMLAASDLCLVTQQRAVADIVFPSKVLTLLSAGRPVVASLSEGSEVARVLRDAGAGVRTEPEDPGALAGCDFGCTGAPGAARRNGRQWTGLCAAALGEGANPAGIGKPAARSCLRRRRCYASTERDEPGIEWTGRVRSWQ